MTKFHFLVVLLVILGNMSIVITCCPVCAVINFEINHGLLINPFIYMTKKVTTKRAFNMK